MGKFSIPSFKPSTVHTPDATPKGPDTKAKGTATPARTQDTFDYATATPKQQRAHLLTTDIPRPVANYAPPEELKNNFPGQKPGTLSPNQTGQIDNAAHLAQFVKAGYNKGQHGPVSIVPATIHQGDKTTPVHLVGISGTEPVKGQSTGWMTNLKIGNELSNPGLRNARAAILQSLPNGGKVVLAGHSQGGMVAQQLAADKKLKKAGVDVIDTVAFGSPLIAAGRRNGEVHRVTAFLDPVPSASLGSVFLGPWASAGNQRIGNNQKMNPLKAHTVEYFNEANPRLTSMDAMGRKNAAEPASISFDPKDRVFFTSPTKTDAK